MNSTDLMDLTEKIMKIVGMVTVFIFCSLCGMAMSRAVKRRINILHEFLDFFDFIIYNLSHFGFPTERIFAMYKGVSHSGMCTLEESGFLNYLTSSGRDGGIYRNTWGETVDFFVAENEYFNSMNDAEAEIIKGFGRSLGTADAARQIEICEAFRAKLSEYLDGKDKDFKDKIKIYRAGGALCGVFLCLLFL